MKKVLIISLISILLSGANAATYEEPKSSSRETFSDSSEYFNKGWTSSNDTITSNYLYLNGDYVYSIRDTDKFEVGTLYIQNGSNTTISNSSITATSNIYVQSKSSSYNPASVTINNSSITTPQLELTSGDNSITNSKALNIDRIKVGDYNRSVSLTIDEAENITSTNSVGLEANYGSTTNIKNVGTYSASGSIKVRGGATVNISNVDKLSVGYFDLNSSSGSGSLTITNSNVELTATNRSGLNGAASLTIDGGSFKSSSAIDVYQGSTLTFKNIAVDNLGGFLSTRTNSKYQDTSATINFDNCTGNLGSAIDLYGYETAGGLPVLNVTNGSNISMSLSKTETYYDYDFATSTSILVTRTTNMRSGTVNVSADSTLNITSNLIQQEESDGQVYTSSVNVKGTLIVDGDVNLSSVNNEWSLTAKSITIGTDSSLVSEGKLSVETLKIYDNASNITLSKNTEFTELDLISTDAELAIGDIINLGSFLKDDETLGIVMSMIETNNTDIYIIKNYGTEDEIVFKGLIDSYSSGKLIVSAVPEPSTYAMIFGAIALGFVVYRRK